MIGDRMDTDVVGGLEAGMRTCLVLSGRLHPHDDRAVPLPADLRPRQRRGLRPRRDRRSQDLHGGLTRGHPDPLAAADQAERALQAREVPAQERLPPRRAVLRRRAWPTWWGRTSRSRWSRRRSRSSSSAPSPATTWRGRVRRADLPRGVQAVVAVGGGVAVDVGKYAGFLTRLPVVAVPDRAVQRRLLLPRGQPDGRRPTGELPGDDPVRRRHRHRGRGRVARPVHLLRHRRPAVEVQRDRRLEARLPRDRRADQRLRRDDLAAERAEPRQPLREVGRRPAVPAAHVRRAGDERGGDGGRGLVAARVGQRAPDLARLRRARADAEPARPAGGRGDAGHDVAAGATPSTTTVLRVLAETGVAAHLAEQSGSTGRRSSRRCGWRRRSSPATTRC